MKLGPFIKLAPGIRVIIVAAIAFSMTCFIPGAYAEKRPEGLKKRSETPKIQKEVIVKVRAIKASNPKDSDESKSQELRIDKRLSDISAKFGGFDFQSFKMISEQEITIPVKKKTEVNLTERTILILRPVYSEEKKVGMWIKWEDTSGERTLLDTRMHFESPEPMLAGTNCKDNKALILAISAVPKE